MDFDTWWEKYGTQNGIVGSSDDYTSAKDAWAFRDNEIAPLKNTAIWNEGTILTLNADNESLEAKLEERRAYERGMIDCISDLKILVDANKEFADKQTAKLQVAGEINRVLANHNADISEKLQVAVEALENIQFQISVFDKGDEMTIAKEALEKIKAK